MVAAPGFPLAFVAEFIATGSKGFFLLRGEQATVPKSCTSGWVQRSALQMRMIRRNCSASTSSNTIKPQIIYVDISDPQS
uniref:Uncharacterized protein n=1 Tax=mine drainage metagenome TaxID=410659 RepID=E6QKX7_9ZZZZ